MPQRDIGLILMRQLASGLALPVWLSDEAGDLLFFNEPAEKLLGLRFDFVGTLSLDDARRLLSFRDAEGNALPGEQTPLLVALREQRPVHRRLWLRGFGGEYREVEVTSFPLVATGGEVTGGVAMFWERNKKPPANGA